MNELISITADAIKCNCGGYASEVDCTKKEIEGPLNCGRSWACCVAAFVCEICGRRYIRKREAPEME